jgi:peptidoglycan/xylan/chitin deacetylase (PgdA/CDA1 family)
MSHVCRDPARGKVAIRRVGVAACAALVAALLTTAPGQAQASGGSPAPPGPAAIPAPPPGGIPLAITVDDLPAHGPLPPGVRRLSVAAQMVGAFMSAQVPAVGFVNGSFGADEPDSRAVLAVWKAAGLTLGNHSFSHLHLSEIGATAFLADVDKGEAFVTGQPRMLRYPFLDEGKDPAVRDAVRSGLAKRKYSIAAVTLSFDDYAYNAPYVRCVAQGDAQAVAALEARYLAAARTDAQRARAITHARLERDVPHVLLLHIGVFSARMMPRLLAQYREMGFTFAPLDAVQKDPFYAAAVDPRKPGPSPTVDALAWGMDPAAPSKLAAPGDEVCPAR